MRLTAVSNKLICSSVLLLLITVKHSQQTPDDDIMEQIKTLIQDQFSLMDSKLTNVQSEVTTINTKFESEMTTMNTKFESEMNKMNTKFESEMTKMNTRFDSEMNNINSKLDNINSRLDNMETTLVSIDSEVPSMGLRSSLTLELAENIKTLQEKHYSEDKELKENIKKLQEKHYTEDKDATEHNSEQLQMLKDKIVSLEDNCTNIKVTDTQAYEDLKKTVSSLSDDVNEIKGMSNSTTELIKIMQQDTNALKEPLHSIQTLGNKSTEKFQELKEAIELRTVPLDDIMTLGVNTSMDIQLQKEEGSLCNSAIDSLTLNNTQIVETLKKMQDQIIEINDHLSNSSEMTTKITNEAIACPDGFFKLSDHGQCFQLFKHAKLSWQDATSFCNSIGLHLAKVALADAITLRRYLLDTYGSIGDVWVDGRSDGSTKFVHSDGSSIQYSSLKRLCGKPSWCPSTPGTDYCLDLEVDNYNWSNYPNGPYDVAICTEKDKYMLCEKLI